MGRAFLTSAALALIATVSSSSCITDTRYAIERQSVWMHASAQPAFFTENDDPIFVVQRRFSLPIRPPSQFALDQLARDAQGKKLPFPRLPWLSRDDLGIEVDFTLQNRGKDTLTVLVFLDGIDEFFAYRPGQNDFHQWERRIEVKPGETVSDFISDFEMDEVATDLATVVNGAPNSNLVVQFESQSTRDPRVKKYIPKVIPGIVAFRMGMQTGEATELALRLSVRVNDYGDRLAARGEKSWQLPTPMNFVPVAPAEGQ